MVGPHSTIVLIYLAAFHSTLMKSLERHEVIYSDSLVGGVVLISLVLENIN